MTEGKKSLILGTKLVCFLRQGLMQPQLASNTLYNRGGRELEHGLTRAGLGLKVPFTGILQLGPEGR